MDDLFSVLQSVLVESLYFDCLLHALSLMSDRVHLLKSFVVKGK